jgi:hypothetical protein
MNSPRDDDELNFSTPSRVEKLLAAWRARWPSSKADSINVWDDVVTTRALLLEKLNERFSKYWEKEVAQFEHLIEGRGDGALSLSSLLAMMMMMMMMVMVMVMVMMMMISPLVLQVQRLAALTGDRAE